MATIFIQTKINRMTYYKSKLSEVINELIEFELDGEDTQYILEQIGMDVQMAIQLTNKYPSIVQERLNELKSEGLI
jgi:hypothetical protein